ncbi:MAG TPA: DUF4433 domain-containing protein [Oscillatoriaceae cyanobacterium M33_DOE_052]|nr:DUF4433 domain-containing protein [Oscillatoriaceae cyanobacterium M33_DOE_052]
MDSNLQNLKEQLEAEFPDLSFVVGGYLRYRVRQTTVQVALSEPRKADIFEEFVLKSALALTPAPTEAEIAEMLGIDSMFVRHTTARLQTYSNLEVGSESGITVKPATQELFQGNKCILQPKSTQKVYAIEDDFTEELSLAKTPLNNNAPPGLNKLDDLLDYYDNSRSENNYNVNLTRIQSFIREGLNNENLWVTQDTKLQLQEEVWRILILLIFKTQDQHFLVKVFFGDNQVYQNDRKFRHIDFQHHQIQLANLLSPSLPRFTPAAFRPEAIEADLIHNEVNTRDIQYLVHFTCRENLAGILQNNAILSVKQLQNKESNYNQIDPYRLDERLNHICCSITYFNFQYHYHVSHKSECWVLLHIRPDYLWKQNTLFCRVNAATGRGAFIGEGFEVFQSLFDEPVIAKNRILTRANKPDNLPTCIQAEVLVQESIAIEDVLRVVVMQNSHVQMVRDAGWKGEIEVLPRLFRPRFDWL